MSAIGTEEMIEWSGRWSACWARLTLSPTRTTAAVDLEPPTCAAEETLENHDRAARKGPQHLPCSAICRRGAAASRRVNGHRTGDKTVEA